MTVELNLARMSEEEILELIKAVKMELEARYKKQVVYEPTGREDSDNAHSQYVQNLRTMLDTLSGV